MAAKKSLSSSIRQQLEEALLEALKRHTESRTSGTRKKKKTPLRKKKAGKKAGKKKIGRKKVGKKRAARKRQA